MNRASVVYFVTFGVLVVGMWVILRVGNGMRPPEDLAGRWELRPAPGAGAPRELLIQQSGGFFDVAMPGRPLVRMKLSRHAVSGAGDVSLTIAANEAVLTADGQAGGDDFRFEFSGPGAGGLTGAYDAHRVARRYLGATHGTPRQPAIPATGSHAR